ncbi:hypothetical protein Syun_020874 [Stephania yunnanensis]|uniref:Malonyl-CoA decarboxylase C-terminal domain-containing protein n=1 Tax=Stephania yunnanensis TaxID=152371 RepID=A0AAP0IGK1_9MAGN
MVGSFISKVVHPISNLTDLKRRLGAGRRYFGYLHPAILGSQAHLSIIRFAISRFIANNSRCCVCINVCGLLKLDVVEGTDVEVPEFNVSYKPHEDQSKVSINLSYSIDQWSAQLLPWEYALSLVVVLRWRIRSASKLRYSYYMESVLLFLF